LKEKELLTEKRVLEAEILERQNALQAIEVLLNRIRQQNGLSPVIGPTMSVVSARMGGNGTRVRGTLKAAKKAAEEIDGPFTRADLFARVEQDNPALAGKISPAAQRSTIRTLLQETRIAIVEEATETSEAKYRGFGLR
jgi:hypothetical protein